MLACNYMSVVSALRDACACGALSTPCAISALARVRVELQGLICTPTARPCMAASTPFLQSTGLWNVGYVGSVVNTRYVRARVTVIIHPPYRSYIHLVPHVLSAASRGRIRRPEKPSPAVIRCLRNLRSTSFWLNFFCEPRASPAALAHSAHEANNRLDIDQASAWRSHRSSIQAEIASRP
jgi:hypothetical protein